MQASISPGALVCALRMTADYHVFELNLAYTTSLMITLMALGSTFWLDHD